MKKFLLSLLCLVGFIAANAGTADLETMNGGASTMSYGSYSTTAGWVAENACILQGTTDADKNPKFQFLGDATVFGVCLNGKTTAVGKLTSPSLNGGIGKLSLTYGYAYGDKNGVSLTINILQNGTVVATSQLVDAEAAQKTAYSYEYDYNVAGDFVIEIVNNSPSASTKYADRAAVWNITWTEYSNGEAPTKVSMPVITPNGGEVTAESTIEITCSTEGAAIYYTIDGNEPTTASTLYSAPFTLSAGATVKAIAVDPTGTLTASSVVSADFTFPVANIGEFITAARKYATTITSPVTVVAQSGSYLFLEDNTGRIVAYGSLTNKYNNGDQLTNVKGTYKLYNGLPEMNVDAASFGTATAGTAVEPETMAIEELSIDNLLAYVKIEGVTIPEGTGKSFTIEDATGTVTMYNSAGIDIVSGENLTVIGFISCYNTTLQILPIEITSASGLEIVEAPVINPNGGSIVRDQEITITCATEDASIYYTINGNEPTTASTLYSAPFTLSEDATVKAIAVKEGMENSLSVEASFTLLSANIKAATFDFTAPSTLNPAQKVSPGGDGTSVDNVTFTNKDASFVALTDAATVASRIFLSTSAGTLPDFRGYANSNFTISVNSGYVISEIQFTGGKVNNTYFSEISNGTMTEKVWSTDESIKVDNVKFTVNKTINVQTITVLYETGEATGGIEDVIVDENTAVEYYNLQGVKVANPENGLYIRIQGNKATKVLVK